VWKGVAIWQNRRQRGERRRRNREERQHEQRKKEQKRRRNCLNTLKPLKGGMGAERPARGNDRGGGLRLSTVGVSMGLESPWKGAWALSADGDSPGAGACGGQFWRGEKKGERKESERASERGGGATVGGEECAPKATKPWDHILGYTDKLGNQLGCSPAVAQAQGCGGSHELRVRRGRWSARSAQHQGWEGRGTVRHVLQSDHLAK